MHFRHPTPTLSPVFWVKIKLVTTCQSQDTVWGHSDLGIKQSTLGKELLNCIFNMKNYVNFYLLIFN